MASPPQNGSPKRGMLQNVAESVINNAVLDINRKDNTVKWVNEYCKSVMPWLKFGSDIRDWLGYYDGRNEWSINDVHTHNNSDIPILFCRELELGHEWYAAFFMGDYGEGVFVKLEKWSETSKSGTDHSLSCLTAVNSLSLSKLYAQVEMLNLKHNAEIRDLRNSNSNTDGDIKSIKENLRSIEKDLEILNTNMDYSNKTAMASIESMRKINDDINMKLDLHRDSIITLMSSDDLLKNQLQVIKNSLKESTEGSVSEIQGAVKKVSSDITKNVTIPASVAMAVISFIQWLLSHYIGK